MAQLTSSAILIGMTLLSCSLALVLARLGLKALFRLLPSGRLPLRVISGGRALAIARLRA